MVHLIYRSTSTSASAHKPNTVLKIYIKCGNSVLTSFV